MMLEVGLWDVITLAVTILLAFFACLFGLARYTLAQLNKRLDERFKAQDESRSAELNGVDIQLKTLTDQFGKQEQARETGRQHWDNQFADIDRKLSDHQERIGRLETAAETAPSHADLSNLHKRINDIADDVALLSGEFKGAKHTLDLIHEFLMKGGK